MALDWTHAFRSTPAHRKSTRRFRYPPQDGFIVLWFSVLESPDKSGASIACPYSSPIITVIVVSPCRSFPIRGYVNPRAAETIRRSRSACAAALPMAFLRQIHRVSHIRADGAAHRKLLPPSPRLRCARRDADHGGARRRGPIRHGLADRAHLSAGAQREAARPRARRDRGL